MEITTYQRFNHDANTIAEARHYIENRAKQLLRLGYTLSHIDEYRWGISAIFITDTAEVYQSLFVLNSYRGMGLYKVNVTHKILTSYQCNIVEYLCDKDIDHKVEELDPYEEYTMIEDFYGSQKAKRTGMYYMNHVDEGLAILEFIGASYLAKRAYAIHPVYQGDEDLLRNHNDYYIESDVMLRVMEYRSVANEYLSTRQIKHINEIRLSPLKDVNDMLIADKVQNYKDFELYHKDTHPRTAELIYYFENWLRKLGISEAQYKELKEKLG